MLQIQNASTILPVTQSIYVTCADVQTIAQASVYYLIGLTSMGSENSLYNQTRQYNAHARSFIRGLYALGFRWKIRCLSYGFLYLQHIRTNRPR